MNENVTKISDDNLAEIKMLHGKFQEMIFKFGNLQIEKLELDRMVSEFVSKEKNLKDEWTNLQKLESDLMDKIIKKYGEINLDMNTGVFTPTNTKA